MTDLSPVHKLRALRPSLTTEKRIRRLRVFGSFARGEETPESDIDLLVEFEHTPGLFEFARLRRELSETLGRRVDLVTPDALHPLLRDAILREARDV